MESIAKLSIPFVMAVCLHTVLLSLFLISFDSKPKLFRQEKTAEIIKASILDEERVQAEAKRLKTEQNNKRLAEQKQQQKLERERQLEEQRLKDLRKKRLTEEKRVQEQLQQQKLAAEQEQQRLKALQAERLEQERKIAIQQKKLAEQERLEKQRIAEIKKRKAEEAKRKEEEKKRKAAKEKERKRKEEAARKEAERLKKKQEQELAEQQRLAEERARLEDEASLKAERDRKAMHTAQYAIQRKVNSRWVRPLSVKDGLKCTIRVKLMASGDVLQAVVVKSSGDPVFDRSAETAVRKAAPLPVPTDPDLFAREFRTFEFVFKPK